MFCFFKKKYIAKLVENGVFEGYYYFLFDDAPVMILREIIQNFKIFFENKHLLVTLIDGDKIDSRLQQYMISKGVIGEFIDGNIIIKYENSKEFFKYLFSESEEGSAIFFITRIPHKDDLKDIDNLPKMPLSYSLFKKQKIEPKLFRQILQKFITLNADLYYHNDFINTFLILKDKNIADGIKALYLKK